MEFINHTPFPALAFEGIDQHDQRFHVVVMRQTLTWNDTGKLFFSDEQQPLCGADEFFDADMQGSVRQESDLCSYKPRCDVIVDAMAYPPRGADGQAPGRFEVRLVVMRPGMPAPLPPQPYGLNPLMPASDEAMHAWRAEIERITETAARGECLIDKTLVVTGERRFVKRTGWARLAAALVTIGTLGIVRLRRWRLTPPESARIVPVRLENAFGGQCRIDAGSEGADKVPPKYRLTAEQAEAHPDSHPDAGHSPVAHDAYVFNPVGHGFTRDWYVDATAANSIPAPQIEYPNRPITIDHFNRTRAGQSDSASVAGLGVRPKGHPERAKRVGTIDQAFIQSDAALPKDFDFAVWNAAWPDQQVDALVGDEHIELVNLCALETPGAKQDARGNTVLTLRLPGHLPFVLVRFQNGAIGELGARLDTLLIDPDKREISCVWRATIGKAPSVRVLEARMLERDHGNAQAAISDTPEEQEEVLHG